VQIDDMTHFSSSSATTGNYVVHPGDAELTPLMYPVFTRFTSPSNLQLLQKKLQTSVDAAQRVAMAMADVNDLAWQTYMEAADTQAAELSFQGQNKGAGVDAQVQLLNARVINKVADTVHKYKAMRVRQNFEYDIKAFMQGLDVAQNYHPGNNAQVELDETTAPHQWGKRDMLKAPDGIFHTTTETHPLERHDYEYTRPWDKDARKLTETYRFLD
jgi:hypothetical protein